MIFSKCLSRVLSCEANSDSETRGCNKADVDSSTSTIIVSVKMAQERRTANRIMNNFYCGARACEVHETFNSCVESQVESLDLCSYLEV